MVAEAPDENVGCRLRQGAIASGASRSSVRHHNAGRRRREVQRTSWKVSTRQMRTAHEGSPKGKPQRDVHPDRASSKSLLDSIVHWLDEAKAEEVVTIDLDGKSTIADFMVVASGRSDRHVGAIGEQVQRNLKELGYGRVKAEGLQQGDWVLIDAGNVVVHVFRPEVREFYKLERMWSGDRPADEPTH